MIWSSTPRSGVYFLPYVDRSAPEEEQQRVMDEAMKGPMVFASIRLGPTWSFPSLLGVQLLIEIVSALLATALLLNARTLTYGGRVLFVLGIGTVIMVAGHLPEWNWYGFSAGYTAVEAFDSLAGWFFAGLVIGRLRL